MSAKAKSKLQPPKCPACSAEGTFVMWDIPPYGQTVATSGGWPLRECPQGHRFTVNGMVES